MNNLTLLETIFDYIHYSSKRIRGYSDNQRPTM